jgi:hypothetical protein
MVAGLPALILAAAFAGAAIFVNVAEQRARLALDDKAALIEWQLSYDRAEPMQGLALLASLHAMRPEQADMQIRETIAFWGRLHGGRSTFGIAATPMFLWALAT